MNIIEQFCINGTLSKRDLYKFIDDPNIISVKSAVGTVIEPDAYIVYEETQTISGKEQDVEIIAIRDKASGDVYATNSPYVQREIKKIFDTYYDPFDEQPLLIEFIEGESAKSGRVFKSVRMV